jgi:Terminase large subunit, T4likevirus-type, N-terminal
LKPMPLALALPWWKAAREASTAPDPGPGCDALSLMRRAGMEPDPWQAHVATTPGDQLLLCHRQAGKSTIVAALALADALAIDNALILLVSRSMRQSTELYRKVKQFYTAVHPIGLRKDTETGMELANGSRILSLPASHETIVGFSAVTTLLLDEAARIPDGTYYAVRPMLAMSQGRLIALSSPFGRRGWFYEAWAEAATAATALDLAGIERLLGDLDFPVDEYSDQARTDGTGPGRDSAGAAWQKTFLPAPHNARLSRAFLARERRTIPDLWFRQEWLCEFVELGAVVFRWEDIMGMVSQDTQPFFSMEGQLATERPVVQAQRGAFQLGEEGWTP